MADPVDLGGGRWRLNVFVNRHPTTGAKIRHRQQVTFRADGIRRARAYARQLEDDVRAALVAALVDPTPTVAAAAEAWWALWVKRPRSPTTRKGYRSIVDGHILRAPFAGARVDEVTTGQVERWYASLPVGPSTVRRIHAVLSQVFDQAVRDGRLERNPASLAYKPESRPKAKTHTPVETVLAVLEAAHRRSPVRSRLLAFAALTGLRRGELCGLRWSAVDLVAGTLIVELNVVKAQQRFIHPSSTSVEPVLHVKDPKAHAIAGIVLDRQATNIAAQQASFQRSQGFVEGADPYLWAVTPPFNVPLHPDTATNWFVQAAKDAGVRGVSLHDLRHWQGSQILEVGGTVQDVKERLRHKSLQTTMGYLHADQSRQRILVDLLPPLELPAEPKVRP